MKFKKFFLLLFLILGSLSLFSCSEKASTIEENPPILKEQEENNNNNATEKEYLTLNVTYTSTVLENGVLEDTVETIYDSVVAIDSYLNRQPYGSGSGVLFGYDEKFSYIATCHHVIEQCQNFIVTLTNNEKIEAKLVGGDSESDIAVLSIEKTNLTYASWYEDTDRLRLASSVICIGNPLGTLPGSVSTGVVSYNNREIQVDDYHSMKLIQTDVAINSGNSGGGLFNYAGALIGIVNAKYSSSGIEGLGFAIPANQARTIIDSILQTAKYNIEENRWEIGYVEGRWDLGFTLGYGGYFVRTSIGIADVAANETSSDYNLLKKNDILNAITITYKNPNQQIQTLTNINAQNMTIEEVYKFIYRSSCQIGDIITLDITRNNENISIDIKLKQYRYSV